MARSALIELAMWAPLTAAYGQIIKTGQTWASRYPLFPRRTRRAGTRLSNPSWARKGPCSCSSVLRIGDRSARSSSSSWNSIWTRSGSRGSV